MPVKIARSDPRPSARVTRGASSGQHLASALQEGQENAKIDTGLGFIWRISVEIAPEPTGHGLPLSKCEAYNGVYGAILRIELRSSHRFSAVGAGPRLRRCGGVKTQRRVCVEQKPRLPC
jgi:hypothetical protein